MRVRGCDRDCSSCVLLDLCGGIEQYGVKGYRCPFADCKLNAPALKRMNRCNICRVGRLTWNVDEGDVARLLSEIRGLDEVKNGKVELPTVVPIVSLKDERSFCWDSLDIRAVIIGFQDLFDKRILDELIKAEDIHSYLDFDGKVLLSSIMPDSLIVDGKTFYLFSRLAEMVNFDAVIAWDSPVYIDIPLYDSWVNLLMGLKLTYEMAKRGVPTIGLLKGNIERQIRFSASTLARMGIKDMALHASEYMLAFSKDATVRQILYEHLGQAEKLANSLLVIGVLNPRRLPFFKVATPKGLKVSLAGMSWFLDAQKGLLYSDDGFFDTTSKYVDCKCEVCFNAGPKALMSEVNTRAKHNLNYLIKQNTKSSTATVMKAYDLTLEDNEEALFVSDIHMWTGRTLLDEFLEFLKEKKPTCVVFLGDVFDFSTGEVELHETAAFFSTLRELGPSVFITKGCSDGDLGSFLSAFNRLVFAGKAKPMLWSQEDDRQLAQLYLDLWRFYACAKERMDVKLANNELIAIEHGHKIIEDRSLPLKQVVRRMEEAKELARARWFVMGHLHRAFINEESGVASTGCWVWDKPCEDGRAGKGDIGTAISVHGNGKLELIRRF